jgi:hypothetical protein
LVSQVSVSESYLVNKHCDSIFSMRQFSQGARSLLRAVELAGARGALLQRPGE